MIVVKIRPNAAYNGCVFAMKTRHEQEIFK